MFDQHGINARSNTVTPFLTTKEFVYMGSFGFAAALSGVIVLPTADQRLPWSGTGFKCHLTIVQDNTPQLAGPGC